MAALAQHIQVNAVGCAGVAVVRRQVVQEIRRVRCRWRCWAAGDGGGSLRHFFGERVGRGSGHLVVQAACRCYRCAGGPCGRTVWAKRRRWRRWLCGELVLGPRLDVALVVVAVVLRSTYATGAGGVGGDGWAQVLEF